MDLIARFTERELSLIRLMAAGLPTKGIAVELGLSVRSVEALLTKLYSQFGVLNRTALVALVLANAQAFGLRGFPEGDAPVAPMVPSISGDSASYEEAPFMIAVTRGLEHRYTFVNRVAAEVAGRPASALIGHTVRELYPQLHSTFAAALDSAIVLGNPWTNGKPETLTFTLPDGTLKLVKVSLIFQPLRDVRGRIDGLLHIGYPHE